MDLLPWDSEGCALPRGEGEDRRTGLQDPGCLQAGFSQHFTVCVCSSWLVCSSWQCYFSGLCLRLYAISFFLGRKRLPPYSTDAAAAETTHALHFLYLCFIQHINKLLFCLQLSPHYFNILLFSPCESPDRYVPAVYPMFFPSLQTTNLFFSLRNWMLLWVCHGEWLGLIPTFTSQ